jgi:hypothetical protein
MTIPGLPPAVSPTPEDLRAYVRGSDRLSQIDIDRAAYSALEDQAAMCRTDPYSWSLQLGALRRGARKLAAQGAPLSTLDMGPLGSVPVSRWDALIEECEAAYRKAPIGAGTINGVEADEVARIVRRRQEPAP